MANIPTYERQVALRPVPAVQPASPPSARDFVGDLPEQLGRVAGIVSQEQEKAREQADSAILMDAYAQLGKARQDVGAWVDAQKGKAALENDVQAQAEERLQKAAAAISDGLPTDRVRAVFAKQRAEASLAVRGAAMSHVAREDDAFRAAAYEGAKATAIDLGVQGAAAAPLGAAADSKDVAAARDQLLGAVAVRLKDAPPEARAAEQTAALTALHGGAVERLLSEQRGADAERYLTRWRGEMDPVVVGKLDERAQAKTQAARVEARASAILRQAAVPGTTWKDPAAASAAVETMDDADPLKPHVRQLVEHQVMLSEQLRQKAGETKLNEARSLLNRGFTLNSRQLSDLRLWMLDPRNDAAGLWDALERGVLSEERARLAEIRQTRVLRNQATAEERRAAAEAKAAQKTANDQARYEFKALPLSEQATVDVPSTFPDVDPVTRARIQADQQRSAAALKQGQEVTHEAFRKQVLNATQGMDPEDAGAILTKLDTWYWEQVQKNQNQPPSSTEVTAKLADSFIMLDIPMGRDKVKILADLRDIEPLVKPYPPEEQAYGPSAAAVASGAMAGRWWDPTGQGKKGRAGAKGIPPAVTQQPYDPVRRTLAAKLAVPTQADVDRIQTEWKARYPGRPPLTADQVARALAAEPPRPTPASEVVPVPAPPAPAPVQATSPTPAPVQSVPEEGATGQTPPKKKPPLAQTKSELLDQRFKKQITAEEYSRRLRELEQGEAAAKTAEPSKPADTQKVPEVPPGPGGGDSWSEFWRGMGRSVEDEAALRKAPLPPHVEPWIRAWAEREYQQENLTDAQVLRYYHANKAYWDAELKKRGLL